MIMKPCIDTNFMDVLLFIHYTIFLKKSGGVVNAPSEALTLQLQGDSPFSMS